MSISVIITLFNGARWIRETLKRVFEQTTAPAKVVVVDDGSTDDSPEIIRREFGLPVMGHPGKGPEAARRFGLAHVETEFVAFLDQDDLWHRKHLEILSAALIADPRAAAAASKVSLCGKNKPPRWSTRHRTAVPLDHWKTFGGTAAVKTPSAVLIRRENLVRCGGWPADYTGVADRFMWLRLTAENATMIQCESVTTGKQVHDSNLSAAMRNRDRIADYLDAAMRASLDAAAVRLTAHPEERALLERRMEICRNGKDAGLAFLDNDWGALREAEEALSQGMHGEPDSYRFRILKSLAWQLRRLGRRDSEVLLRMLCAWPRGDRATSQILRGMLGRRFRPGEILRDAWSLRLICPASLHAVIRASGRCEPAT